MLAILQWKAGKFPFRKLMPFLGACILTMSVSVSNAQKLRVHQQAPKRCGTMEAIESEMRIDQALRARIQQGELDYQESLKKKNSASWGNRPASPTSLPGPVYIPLVVHIVLPNPWIITDDAVERFVDRLNTDFSGLNADSSNAGVYLSSRGHSLIRFVLARRDPSGNFTTGVIRKIGTTQIAQTTNQPIKNSATATGGSTGWDISKYYNLYIGDGGASGLLGIAPAIGPGTAAGTNAADGICMDYRCVYDACFSYAEFNMGRTAVHEIGHNFGLYHPFDNGCATDDFRQLSSAGCSLPPSLLAPADDVPNQSAATSGCPSGNIANGCSPSAAKMYQNYMDYTDDACYSMFTHGEVARMEWVLENCRSGYLTTPGGQYPDNMQQLDAAVHSVVSPGGQDYNAATCTPISYPAQTCPGTFIPRLRITNAGSNTLTSVTVTTSINGANFVATTVTVNLATGKSTVVVLNPQVAVTGNNALKFELNGPNGGIDGNASNNTLTINFTVSGTLSLPYTENFSNAAFPPANGTSINNPDGPPDPANGVGFTWERTTLAGRPGPASMRINCYNYQTTGERDIYRLPPISTNNFDSVKVSFNYAYQQYFGTDVTTPPNDSLRLVYSTDCGNTWHDAGFAEGGAGLSTVASTTDQSFVPTGIGQWKSKTVVLKDFCNYQSTSVILGFESYNAFGNNIYVDSISITAFNSVTRNAIMLSIDEPLPAACTGAVKPVVTFGNAGLDPLTALNISYIIDGSRDTITYNWTGNLSKCEKATVSLPSSNVSVNPHIIEVFTSLPNGNADQVTSNDKLSKQFAVFTTAALPISEGFENTAFPSSNWGVVNVTGGSTFIRSAGNAKTGVGAMVINNSEAGNTINATDYFISPIVMNSNGYDSVYADFDLAYKAGATYPGSTVLPLDTLEISATKDCGQTFISVWKKWGNELQTINDPNYAYTNAFVPKQGAEWKKIKVYLTPYVGADNFQLYFVMKGNKQNSLWLDNINISAQKLPQRLKDQGYLIYPNPFNNSFLIHHYAVEPPVDLQSVQVFNSAGQLVWDKRYNGNAGRQITVNLGNASKGIYILKMIYTNKTIVERIVKN